MRVYHFINEQYGLADLQEKHLKIARINELNDPFEFMGADLSDHEFREAIGGLKIYLNKKWGLLCFSKDWGNPVQWTHYADEHKGLCLGFDVPDRFLVEVKYKDKRLSVNSFRIEANRLKAKLSAELDDYAGYATSPEDAHVKKDGFINEVAARRLREECVSDTQGLEFAKKILSTKFFYWSYEQEHRVFPILSSAKRIGNLYYVDFSDELRLKEVIIGVRACVTTNRIKSALGEIAGSVDVFKVREAYREFTMVKDENAASHA